MNKQNKPSNLLNTEPKKELLNHEIPNFDEAEDPTESLIPEQLQEAIEHLDESESIDVNNYIDPEKIKALELKYLEQLKKQRKAQGPQVKPETMTVNGKTISKASKVAGQRTTAKQHVDSDIVKEAQAAGLKQNDAAKVADKVHEVIKELEKNAEQIEKSMDFNIDETKIDVNECRKFLFSTAITGINGNGISTDDYVAETCNMKYSTKNQPNESSINDPAKQLVFINRLSKRLKYNFLKSTTMQLKFNCLEETICMYIKQQQFKDYKYAYIMLKELLKKLIIVSLSDVEGAFRSEHVWIKNEFVKMIRKDIIMLQSLPPKLKKSWNIFIKELCKINDANVFNDLSKIDYVIHVNDDFVIESILAQTIKCMTPCFILNYYEIVKCFYLATAMIDGWFGRVEESKKQGQKVPNQEWYQELRDIILTVGFIYENTRLNENSTARSLPFSVDKPSEELQMYYLNHTVVGPQFMILKALQKYIYGLV